MHIMQTDSVILQMVQNTADKEMTFTVISKIEIGLHKLSHNVIKTIYRSGFWVFFALSR